MPAGDWTYTVVGYESQGVYDLLLGINQFNEPPPAGKRYVRARIRATWSGTGTGAPTFIQINLVDSEQTISASVSPCCTPESDELRDQPDVFAGASAEGWLYYTVNDATADGRQLAFDPNVEYTDVPGGVGFFEVWVG